MDKALTWFIYCWASLAIFVNVVAVVGFFVAAATFWDGWTRVIETYSPINVANFFMELLLLSPVIGAMYWRGRRRASRLKIP